MANEYIISNKKDKRLFKTCLLTAIGTGLIVLSESYGTMLFLRSYSADILPYLYLCQGGVIFTITQIIQPWIKKDILDFIKKSHIIFAITLIPFFYFLSKDASFVDFILSLLITSVAFIANVSYWSLVALIFNLREFKQLGRWPIVSATLGGLTIGLVVPILLKYLPPNSLLLFLIILIGITYLLVLKVKLKKEVIKGKISTTHKTHPILRHPLFIYLFISFLLMMFTFIAADFNLKKELALVYSEKQIGSFLAPFFAATMGITVIGQLFIAPMIINRIGIAGLISIYPIIACIGSIGVLQYPSLISAIFLAGAAQVGRYVCYSTGKKMIINVFPKPSIIEANFQLKSIAKTISTILSAAILAILASLKYYQVIIILIIIVNVIMIFITLKINTHYLMTLKSAINLQRFSFDYLRASGIDNAVKNEIIKLAIQNDNEDLVLFALSLMRSQSLKRFPDNAMKLVTSASKNIKLQLIKMLQDIKDETATNKFFEHLAVEKDPELVWKISEAILEINPCLFLSKAPEEIESSSLPIKSRAICVYALTGSEDQLKLARNLYLEMANSKNSIKRIWAAKILNCSPHIELPTNSVCNRLKDENIEVVRGLIKAAQKIHDKKIVDVLLDKIAIPKLRYITSKTLLTIGIKYREQIINKIVNSENLSVKRNLIALLAQYDEPSVEQDLIRLTELSDISITSNAIVYLSFRTRTSTISTEGEKKVYTLIIDTVNYVQALLLEREKNKILAITEEINSRLAMLKRNFLHLLSIYFSNDTILRLAPTLLYVEKSRNIYARAMELLETCITLPKIRMSIDTVLTEVLPPKSKAQKFMVLEETDPWFKQLKHYFKGELEEKHMDIINKVLIIRRLSLFSKLFPEAIQTVAENLETLEVNAGEQIFAEGDLADGLYILSKGKFKIIKNNGMLVSRYKAPAFFGELALIDEEPRYASAIATTDAQLYFLDKVTFLRLINEQPEILMELTKLITKYYRETGQEHLNHG